MQVRPGPDIEFSGIQEYSLPLDERLRKREAIEKAKREFVEDRCADADRVDVRTIPSNVGSNFNLYIAAPGRLAIAGPMPVANPDCEPVDR